MNEALDARSDAIEGGIKRAEEAQAEAAGRAREVHRAARRGARRGRCDPRRRPARTARRSSPSCASRRQAEAARITANAQAQIEAERQPRSSSLRSEVGTLALDLAGGVIGETLSDDKKAQAVVDRFLAELEAVRGEGGEVMGSATTQALAATTTALDAATGVDLDTAARAASPRRAIVGDSPQLSGALADPAASPRRPRAGRRPTSSARPFAHDHGLAADDGRRAALVARASELVDGIEELGRPRRRDRRRPSVDVEGELFAFSRDRRRATPSSSSRSAAGSATPPRRPRSSTRCSAARASAATIAHRRRHLVQQPRDRRVGELLAPRDATRRRPARQHRRDGHRPPRRSAPRRPSA